MDNACRSSLVESPMGPRSPPAAALDLYGKRRQMVKVQVLEREIGLLQEELKSVEDVQPASICCKEVDDFVGAKPDPLVAIKQESHKPNPFWKSLWGKFCSSLMWICCSTRCLHHLQILNCCKCDVSCHPHCHICICSEKVTCQEWRKCMGLSCLHNACCCFKSGHNCTKVNLCSNLAKCCSNTCCL
ncbi:hypothetical protein AB3S75_001477 [Citrus x aurantiifolia]